MTVLSLVYKEPMTPSGRPVTDHEIVARYADRIDYLAADGCWEWKGRVNNWGYSIASRGQERTSVHRLFYECLVGPIAEGMVIDHMCRNRLCVNPTHLQAVTHSENVALGGTRKTHCPQGHSYDDAYFRANGNRVCRQCAKANNDAAALRRKEAIAS